MQATTRSKETQFEAESRKVANFPDVEESLTKRFAKTEMTYLDKITSLLGARNPFKKKANPQDNEVWLLNNTAHRPIDKSTGKPGPWQAEFVAAFFVNGRADINSAVADILDTIGLDGNIGEDPGVRQIIEERLRPFVQQIAPARTVDITIPTPDATQGGSHVRTLGPSDGNGISSQDLMTGGRDDSDGKTVACTSTSFPNLKNQLRFAGPDGWAIISDIDDTVKRTMTPDPLGVLKSTFIEPTQVIGGMPELYKTLHAQFNNPAWFYLSASPYNLYPFLHTFLSQHFPAGTIILRDSSWMFFAGLLQSLTEGVQEYKTDRLEKIHSWLPRRKVICIGDSTQSDPESYAAIYKKYPDWIKAIYIRKVTDAPFMERKNEDKRFDDAFKDVPESVWKVFVQPAELEAAVRALQG